MPTRYQYEMILPRRNYDYNVMGAVTKCTLSEKEGQLAQTLSFDAVNIVHSGTELLSLFGPDNPVRLLADDGESSGEVFQGEIWNQTYNEEKKTISYTCYDPLIYLQKSSDALFFPAGRPTLSILQEICGKWNVPLDYSYESASMEKKAFSNTRLSDMILEILEDTKRKTGKPYQIRFQGGKLLISGRGVNTTRYELAIGKNLTSVQHTISKENLITQIIITGKASENGGVPVEAVLTASTAEQRGTLQSVRSRSGDTSLAEAKKEAQEELDEHKNPEHTYSLSAPDYPFLRKGDSIQVNTGSFSGVYYVKSITHELTSHTMNLEIEP